MMAVGQMQQRLFGAIEGGGTKFVCAVGTSPTTLLERAVVPTTDPATTLGECLRFLADATRTHGPLAALGIGCFGPLQLQPGAPGFGCLLDTPKQGWSGARVLQPLREKLGFPVVIDTDVGAAARGELALGSGRGLESLAYITVGTGIGGALAPPAGGRHLMHAEMGHLLVRRDPRDSGFAGTCSFHGDCVEGLASGPAIQARWGSALAALPAAHPGRSIIAGYLGQLATTIALLHAPEAIVFGGGVMSDGTLLPLVRAAVLHQLRGYLPPLREASQLDAFIRAPGLGPDSALAGAMLMAMQALPENAAAT